MGRLLLSAWLCLCCASVVVHSQNNSNQSNHSGGGGGNVPFSPVFTCQRYQGTVCREVVGNFSFAFVSNFTQTEAFMGRFLRALIYVVNGQCRAALVNYQCGIHFPQCDDPAERSSQPVHCPCSSILQQVQSACETDPVGKLLAQDAIKAQSKLARVGRPCSVLQDSPSTGCFKADGSTGLIECPDYLVPPTAPGSRSVYLDNSDPRPEGWGGGDITACALPCTPRLFTHHQAQDSVLLVTTLAWISTVATALLFLILYVDGFTLAWPEKLQVYFAICVFFLSFALTFASMIGYSDTMWCENTTLCTLQAAMLEYFGLALALWWLAICLNLFLSMVVYHPAGSAHFQQWRVRRQADIRDATQSWEKLYHAVAWGIPALFTLVLLPQGKLGNPAYGDPSYCFITDEGGNGTVWEFAFFYVEMSVFVVLGVGLFGAVLYKLRRLSSHEFSMWKLVRTLSVLLAFIFAFIFTFLFMVIYQISLSSEESEDRKAYGEFVQCLVQQWGQAGLGQHYLQCKLKSHPDLVAMNVQGACLASLGIVTFLVFGLGTLTRQVKVFCQRHGWWREGKPAGVDTKPVHPEEAQEGLLPAEEAARKAPSSSSVTHGEYVSPTEGSQQQPGTEPPT